MIFLDDIKELSSTMSFSLEDLRCLRIHRDVVELAQALASDPDKLRGAAPFIFMPAHRTWIEWEDHNTKFGFMFDGERTPTKERSVTAGFGLFCLNPMDGTKREPIMMGTEFDIPDYKLMTAPTMGLTLERALAVSSKSGMSHAQVLEMWEKTTKLSTTAHSMTMVNILTEMKPSVWAILALINSPKIIRQIEVDTSRINRKREAMGRYTFHPHHEVRLNVDKHVISTVTGEGEGSSKCLHFVRTHLRFVPSQGNYTLVTPHWRGDPALGIRDTHYRADRQNSRWAD